MIKVSKEQKGTSMLVRLSGTIEESVNFDELIGATAPEMQISCKEVSRINSVGVKIWIKYFSSLAAKGIKLQLVECSVPIVEQINLISNFTCGAQVESIFVPFSCTMCKTELLGLFRTDDIRKVGMKLPEVKCSKCGGKALFDDIPEEYFGFLER